MSLRPGDAVLLTRSLAYTHTYVFNRSSGGAHPDWLSVFREQPILSDGSVVLVLSVLSSPSAVRFDPAPDPNPTVGFMSNDGTFGWTTWSRLKGHLMVGGRT